MHIIEPAPSAPGLPVPPLPTPVSTREGPAVPRPSRGSRRAGSAATFAPAPAPPAPRQVAVVGSGPAAVAEPRASRVATLERPVALQLATVVLEQPPSPHRAPARASRRARPSLAGRIAALPRVLLETVAWGGFAAVVALVVIALSDVGLGPAALWAAALSGIVVLAVAVMAVTGAHLDELNSATRVTGQPD